MANPGGGTYCPADTCAGGGTGVCKGPLQLGNQAVDRLGIDLGPYRSEKRRFRLKKLGGLLGKGGLLQSQAPAHGYRIPACLTCIQKLYNACRPICINTFHLQAESSVKSCENPSCHLQHPPLRAHPCTSPWFLSVPERWCSYKA